MLVSVAVICCLRVLLSLVGFVRCCFLRAVCMLVACLLALCVCVTCLDDDEPVHGLSILVEAVLRRHAARKHRSHGGQQQARHTHGGGEGRRDEGTAGHTPPRTTHATHATRTRVSHHKHAHQREQTGRHSAADQSTTRAARGRGERGGGRRDSPVAAATAKTGKSNAAAPNEAATGLE